MEFYSLVVLGTKPRAVIKGLGSVLPPPIYLLAARLATNLVRRDHLLLVYALHLDSSWIPAPASYPRTGRRLSSREHLFSQRTPNS